MRRHGAIDVGLQAGGPCVLAVAASVSCEPCKLISHIEFKARKAFGSDDELSYRRDSSAIAATVFGYVRNYLAVDRTDAPGTSGHRLQERHNRRGHDFGLLRSWVVA